MKNIFTLTPLVLSIRSLAFLPVVAALVGCGPDVWKWQEEAKLESGQTITVERQVIFGGARLPWENERLQSEYVLRFASADNPGNTFEYRSIGGLAPGAIAFVKGTPYVLGVAVRGDAITYYDCPDPRFVIHRYESGRWKRAELRDIPPSFQKMNLALFSENAMSNAKRGGTARADQIESWNSTLGPRLVGRYAASREAEIIRPPSGKVEYDCNVPGKPDALLNLKEFKEQIRRKIPKNVE